MNPQTHDAHPCTLDLLRNVRNEFTMLTNVPAAILDDHGAIVTPPNDRLPICAMADVEMTRCAGCREKLARRALEATGPFSLICPMTNLHVAVCPISPGGERRGCWVIGHARFPDEEARPPSDDLPSSIKAAIISAPVIREERFLQLINFLFALTEAAERLVRIPSFGFPTPLSPTLANEAAPEAAGLFETMSELFSTVMSQQDVEKSFDEALRIIGEHYEVSRAFAFLKGGGPFYANTHEWCAPGVASQKERFRSINMQMMVGTMLDLFRRDGVVAVSDIGLLPDDLCNELMHAGIASVALLPIWRDGDLVGFVGFDDLLEHEWSAEELVALWNVAMIFSGNLERVCHQLEARTEESLLTDILNSTGLNVFVADAYTDEIIWMNDTLREQYEATDEIIGRKCYDVIQGRRERCPFCKVGKLLEHPEINQITWENHSKKWNRSYLVYDSIVDWIDGRKVHIEYALDTTEYNRRQRELEYFATTDSLTGTVNRSSLMKVLDRALRTAERESTTLSVAFIDIDGLKAVNDSCGHNAGDLLIERAANALRAHTRSTDTIGRIGGDEFIVVMPRCDRSVALERIYQAQKHLQDSTIAGCDIRPSFSYGIADNLELSYSGNMSNLRELISLADERMRINKKLYVKKELRR